MLPLLFILWILTASILRPRRLSWGLPQHFRFLTHPGPIVAILTPRNRSLYICDPIQITLLPFSGQQALDLCPEFYHILVLHVLPLCQALVPILFSRFSLWGPVVIWTYLQSILSVSLCSSNNRLFLHLDLETKAYKFFASILLLPCHPEGYKLQLQFYRL